MKFFSISIIIACLLFQSVCFSGTDDEYLSYFGDWTVVKSQVLDDVKKIKAAYGADPTSTNYNDYQTTKLSYEKAAQEMNDIKELILLDLLDSLYLSAERKKYYDSRLEKTNILVGKIRSAAEKLKTKETLVAMTGSQKSVTVTAAAVIVLPALVTITTTLADLYKDHINVQKEKREKIQNYVRNNLPWPAWNTIGTP